ncbi:MAG TPA: hypothetical protein VMV98_09355 [Acidobacteriaceae bacterium]|nr:hypothetical protein [Acidobacteriaceae bacterium]
MARACVENVAFIALACDQQQHVTTLAHFVATLDKQVEAVFCDVLMVCNAQGLIGNRQQSILPMTSFSWRTKTQRVRLNTLVNFEPAEPGQMVNFQPAPTLWRNRSAGRPSLLAGHEGTQRTRVTGAPGLIARKPDVGKGSDSL